MKKHLLSFASVAVLALAAAPVYAQWSNTPSSNFAVASGPGDQIQPKIVPTPDGGSWISWFDGNNGYSVHLQRLDSVGNPMLGPNGILVATRGYSSTQDYGLSVDAAGDALLAFRTDQYGSGDEIEAQVVAPDGTLVWGPDGIEFGNGADFVADPKIAATSDGNIVVGWTDNADYELVGVDSSGNQLWSDDISDPNGNSLTLSDLHGSDSGSVIASYVSASGFSGPKHLLAEKFDSSGTSEWTDAVYDGGSLQFGNFPTFIPDGSGGAVFAWYDSTNLQSHVQHLAADGSEIFPHNGVLVANVAGDIQVEPSAAYDPATQDIFVFWTEEDASTQGNRGVSGQRVDASGNLAWGSGGLTILPKTTNADYLTSTVATSDDGTIVFFSGGVGSDQLYAARLDTNGNFVWNPNIADVSSTPASKYRLGSIIYPNDMAVVTWEDTGAGNSDILAQNVNGDGSLGATCPADYTAYPGTLNPGEHDKRVTYFAPSGVENGILISPPGFDLLLGVRNQQQNNLFNSSGNNEIHHWFPSSGFGWIVKAWSAGAGGSYTLCVKRP